MDFLRWDAIGSAPRRHEGALHHKLRDDDGDDQHDDRRGRGVAEVEELEAGAVDEIADRLGAEGGAALGDDEDVGEHRGDVDRPQDERHGDDRFHHRKRDVPEDRVPCRTIKAGGLFDLFVLTLKAGNEDDEQERRPLPHVRKDQDAPAHPCGGLEGDVAVDQADLHQQVGKDPAIEEEQLVDEGHRRGHEQHRHEEDDPPTLHPRIAVGVEGQRQRQHALQDQADRPDHEGVPERAPELVVGQQLFIIGKPDGPPRAELHLVEALDDGVDAGIKRDQHEVDHRGRHQKVGQGGLHTLAAASHRRACRGVRGSLGRPGYRQGWIAHDELLCTVLETSGPQKGRSRPSPT